MCSVIETLVLNVLCVCIIIFMIFLDGDNVTSTSYTPIDHVQWQISNQGLHGRNLFFRYFSGVGT